MFAREPLRETAHRLMIRVHIADGNSYEAIRQYQLYERLTLTRIGLPPSPQMRELVSELLPDELAVARRRRLTPHRCGAGTRRRVRPRTCAVTAP